jgi:hypothetical protein
MNSLKRRALKVAAPHDDVQLDDNIGMSLEECDNLIRAELEYLEQLGLIYDTGRRRNGEIVYAATPTSKEYN